MRIHHFARVLTALAATALLLTAGSLAACDGCKSDEAGEEEGEAASAEEGEADDEGDEGEGKGEDDEAEGEDDDSPEARVAAARERLEQAKAGRQKPRGGLGEDDEAEGEERKAPSGAEERSARKLERSKRIEELKKRNEERRKERMARLSDRPGAPPAEPGAEPEDGGEDPAAAEPAAEPEKPERPEPAAAAPPPPTKPGREKPAPKALRPKPASTLAKGPMLDIARFLTVADVRNITDDQTLTPVGGLSGIVPSETYNSTYFAPPARANFGVSLQVWQEKTRRDANERYRRMRNEYPNAEDTTAVTAKSYFSYWNDIMSVTFADLTRRTVVSVSCSQKICKPAQLLEMANTVKKRI